MQRVTTTLLTVLIGTGFGLAGSTVPGEADALVFCSKNRKPEKIKVRGDACRANETEVAAPESADLRSDLSKLAKRLSALSDPDRTYVASQSLDGRVRVKGASIACDEGDIATGGGVTSALNGTAGPFLGHSGPYFDESGVPVGWRAGIVEAREGMAIHVFCVDLPDPPPPLTIDDPSPPVLQ